MPSKYVIRSFTKDSYYHVFNRGVEKRKIFKDKQDYQIFKYYLFIYLVQPKAVLTKYPQLPLRLHGKNLNDQLDLLAYSLMSNHFHLLLKQIPADAISRFMKQLTNAYTEYFNTKYHRIGSLMQGRFKAALISSDDLLVHISRYIHLNPLVDGLVKDLKDYPWSSYLNYLGVHKDDLCKKEDVLNQFSSVRHYQQFVQDQEDYAKEFAKVKHSTIEN